MNSSGDNISGGDIFSLFLNSDIINLLFFSFLKSVLLNVIKYWQPNFDDSYTTFMSDCFKWLKVEGSFKLFALLYIVIL
ncbi:MAG: hypothetical protein PWP52_1345, partial [Bacteroidales bacterium]|nr:hypothetical protein [Bacteroidales bacterium]